MADPETAAAPAADEVPTEAGEAAVATIDPIGPETLAAHLKIATAFRVFDHEQNNTVDVRYDSTTTRPAATLVLLTRRCVLPAAALPLGMHHQGGYIGVCERESARTRERESKRRGWSGLSCVVWCSLEGQRWQVMPSPLNAAII